MADLSLNNLLVIGSGAPTYISASVAPGDRAPNPNGRTRIWCINDGGAKVMTVHSNRDSDFGSYPDYTIAIPAGTFYPVPSFNVRRFNTVDGFISFEFDSVTDLRIAAVEDESIFKS